MLATVVGAMATAIARETGEGVAAGPFAQALIGSGASLLGRRDRRAVGLILLAAGGLLLWRETVAAERTRAALRPARIPDAPPRPASDAPRSPR